MSLFEMFLVSGGMLAYWTVYGCSLHLPATNAQWRTPLSLQIVLAAIVVVSSFLVPESPRWLAKQNRHDEAMRNLCYLRSAALDSKEVAVESRCICNAADGSLGFLELYLLLETCEGEGGLALD